MTAYNIQDFDSGDLEQYFGNTYVPYDYNGHKGAGQIIRFLDDGFVYIDNGIQTISIPLSAITWEGLPPCKCVEYSDGLAFVSYAGVRTYKKPVTVRNLTALIYAGSITPAIRCPGGKWGGVSSDMITRYMNTTYPTIVTIDYIYSALEIKKGVLLDRDSGILHAYASGMYVLISRGVIIKACESLHELLDTPEVLSYVTG